MIIAAMRSLICSLLLATCALPLAAKESRGTERGKPDDKEPPVVWREHLVAGPAVLLRMKRGAGKFQVYEGTIERTQRGINSYTESGTFYITAMCAARRDENIAGRNRTLDLIAFRRSFTDRKRTEKRENGKIVELVLENTDEKIDLGPNADFVGTLRCHAFDAQNCAAYRSEHLAVLKDGRQLRGQVLKQSEDKVLFLPNDADKLELQRAEIESILPVATPHIVLGENPHYLFPPFPEREVAPGATWKFRIPVIMPLQMGNPPQVLPTQFDVQVIGRLCEVRESAGSKVATIEYRVNGVFDSGAEPFVTRFPDSFHQNTRIVHKLTGEGVLRLDLDKGCILDKSEVFEFALYSSGVLPADGNKPARREEKQVDLSSRFTMKWLPPGTRLKNGKVIPDDK
ncbi:MAG TPA: hypothetical protein VGP72_11385 [Planctomycetota bacterium]|jgi:hypothetical protein